MGSKIHVSVECNSDGRTTVLNNWILLCGDTAVLPSSLLFARAAACVRNSDPNSCGESVSKDDDFIRRRNGVNVDDVSWVPFWMYSDLSRHLVISFTICVAISALGATMGMSLASATRLAHTLAVLPT